jgi:hypothetical protein
MFHLIWYILIGLIFGGYREIGDARPYDDVLDNRARHHRIDHRRWRQPHVLFELLLVRNFCTSQTILS